MQRCENQRNGFITLLRNQGKWQERPLDFETGISRIRENDTHEFESESERKKTLVVREREDHVNQQRVRKYFMFGEVWGGEGWDWCFCEGRTKVLQKTRALNRIPRWKIQLWEGMK